MPGSRRSATQKAGDPMTSSGLSQYSNSWLWWKHAPAPPFRIIRRLAWPRYPSPASCRDL